MFDGRRTDVVLPRIKCKKPTAGRVGDDPMCYSCYTGGDYARAEDPVCRLDVVVPGGEYSVMAFRKGEPGALLYVYEGSEQAGVSFETEKQIDDLALNLKNALAIQRRVCKKEVEP